MGEQNIIQKAMSALVILPPSEEGGGPRLDRGGGRDLLNDTLQQKEYRISKKSSEKYDQVGTKALV